MPSQYLLPAQKKEACLNRVRKNWDSRQRFFLSKPFGKRLLWWLAFVPPHFFAS